MLKFQDSCPKKRHSAISVNLVWHLMTLAWCQKLSHVEILSGVQNYHVFTIKLLSLHQFLCSIKRLTYPSLVIHSEFSIWSMSDMLMNIRAASWQNQQNDCAPSEDSDQPGHLPSLIRVFAVRMKKAWVLSYPLSAQRRLWSDWADAQADLSLRWVHSHFVGFVMRRLIIFCLSQSTIWILSLYRR